MSLLKKLGLLPFIIETALASEGTTVYQKFVAESSGIIEKLKEEIPTEQQIYDGYGTQIDTANVFYSNICFNYHRVIAYYKDQKNGDDTLKVVYRPEKDRAKNVEFEYLLSDEGLIIDTTLLGILELSNTYTFDPNNKGIANIQLENLLDSTLEVLKYGQPCNTESKK